MIQFRRFGIISKVVLTVWEKILENLEFPWIFLDRVVGKSCIIEFSGFVAFNIQKNIKKNFLPIFFYQCAAGSRHCIAYQGCHTTAWGHFSTVRKPSHTSHTLRNPLHTSHTVKKFHLRDITVQSEKIPDISNTVKILKTGMDQKSVTILETSHTFKRTPLKCRSLCTERISLNRLAYITM